MPEKQGIGLAVTAFALYILGGVATFSGLALVFIVNGRDIWGWGEGRGIGYLSLCAGLFLSVLGVLLMRLFRNRGMS